MSPVCIYNVESSENKEKTLNEKVCPNIFLVNYRNLNYTEFLGNV